MRSDAKTFLIPLATTWICMALPALAAHGGWIAENHRGFVPYPVHFPEGYRIVGLEVREQEGYGVVNMRFLLEDGVGQQVATCWGTENWRGSRRRILLPPGAMLAGIEAKQDGSFGLVDFRLAFWEMGRPEIRFTSWVCGYPFGQILRDPIDPRRPPIGFEVREKSGHGVINFRQILPHRIGIPR
jgi:hypothetical protein